MEEKIEQAIRERSKITNISKRAYKRHAPIDIVLNAANLIPDKEVIIKEITIHEDVSAPVDGKQKKNP